MGLIHTRTAGLDVHVCLAQRVGIDLNIFVWTSVCDMDFGKGAFEELCDGLWAVFARVVAPVDHGPDELGGGIGVVSSTHDGEVCVHGEFLLLVARSDGT